jgi:hypothetical protein
MLLIRKGPKVSLHLLLFPEFLNPVSCLQSHRPKAVLSAVRAKQRSSGHHDTVLQQVGEGREEQVYISVSRGGTPSSEAGVLLRKLRKVPSRPRPPFASSRSLPFCSKRKEGRRAGCY